MGFLKRVTQKREDDLWGHVTLAADERRIDHAHLVVGFEHGKDVPGTAMLTNRRFLWLTQDGSVRMDFALSQCGGFASTNARPGQPGFVIGFSASPNEKPEPLVLFPQQSRSAANRQLATDFFAHLVEQLKVVHPEWDAPA